MAKRSRRKRARQEERRRQRRSAPWLKPVLWSAAIVAAVFVGIFVVGLGGSGRPESPQALALAEANAGGSIRVIRGSPHIVYHLEDRLPTAAAPSTDPRPTLVWFSGTWCQFCDRMSPFAHATASEFSDRLVFVEKSIDHDRTAAARYGVRGTPWFILIDATGCEIGRFSYQSSATALTQAIEGLLVRAGA